MPAHPLNLFFNRLVFKPSLFHFPLLAALAAFLLLLAATPLHADAAIWYVDADSPAATPDGASWATAYPSIQTAIDAAVAAGASETTPAEVWVASGTYTATANNIVTMVQYINLYGGFSGTEIGRDMRNVENNLTTIDGENTHRCVYAASYTILDGFALTRGKSSYGGGLYCSDSYPIVKNCSFIANSAEEFIAAIILRYLF